MIKAILISAMLLTLASCQTADKKACCPMKACPAESRKVCCAKEEASVDKKDNYLLVYNPLLKTFSRERK